MKMQPMDVMGSIYSSGGLRFGGFRTSQFNEMTSELENSRPGVREEIMAEAHYLTYWLYRFPEIAFFIGALLYESLLAGCLCFIGGYIYQIFRFYTPFFRASPLVSQLCRFWEWIKIPLFIGTAILLWPDSKVLSIAFIIFLVLQGWFSVVSSVIMLPVRILIIKLAYMIFRNHSSQIHNIEGVALQMVIERWYKKIFNRDYWS